MYVGMRKFTHHFSRDQEGFDGASLLFVTVSRPRVRNVSMQRLPIGNCFWTYRHLNKIFLWRWWMLVTNRSSITDSIWQWEGSILLCYILGLLWLAIELSPSLSFDDVRLFWFPHFGEYLNKRLSLHLAFASTFSRIVFGKRGLSDWAVAWNFHYPAMAITLFFVGSARFILLVSSRGRDYRQHIRRV